jgi:hypothetical protein
MVDVMGHVAMTLLFALPAWLLLDGLVPVLFAALALSTSLLPDVDLVVSALFPTVVSHHGVTHTVLFVTLASVAAGAVVTWVVERHLDTDAAGRAVRGYRMRVFGFATGAFLLGGLSHLVADLLSAPDVAPPVEPFWPVLSKPWAVDLVWYDAAWVNSGFLVVIVLAHLALFAVVDPFDRRSPAGEGRA